jgi:hypothetical protein
MASYLVEWSIDIDAESPEEAARLALATQRDPDSTAVMFYVRSDDRPSGVMVDLLDELEGTN